MKIVNRKFHREYEELEKLEAGIVLSGAEVKSIRDGSLKLDDAYVKIMGGEARLTGELEIRMVQLYPLLIKGMRVLWNYLSPHLSHCNRT